VIFGGRPEKFQAVLESLADEFAIHADTLRTSLRDQDAAAVRALRHRLHTAVVQLKLRRLATMLDSLLTAGDTIHPDQARHRECIEAITAVSRFLRTGSAGG
jgi:hypothetical protein